MCVYIIGVIVRAFGSVCVFTVFGKKNKGTISNDCLLSCGKKIKMDWAQPMVYSEEFSRKERPTIEEYDITHDERTDEKI